MEDIPVPTTESATEEKDMVVMGKNKEETTISQKQVQPFILTNQASNLKKEESAVGLQIIGLTNGRQ